MAELDTLANDVLTGKKAIADFTGESERRTQYLLETGQIPAGKLGRRWVGSKSALRQHYARLTAGRGA